MDVAPRAASKSISVGRTGFLSAVGRFPMLGPEHEYALAKSWRERRERDAANLLVTSHLRLVVKIAARYRGYGLPFSELISEGNVGLMRAVYRFEPDRGFRFASYAIWWIKAAIQEYVLRSWSLVRIGTTASQRKLFFNLRRAKRRVAALESGDLRPDQVAAIAVWLSVSDRDVIDMNRRLSGDTSLNAPIRERSDLLNWQDLLVDDSAGPEIQLAERQEDDNRRAALGVALAVLSVRERRIFERRQLADAPTTLQELADEFGLSRERVRQIEVRAFWKVQKIVKQNLAAIKESSP